MHNNSRRMQKRKKLMLPRERKNLNQREQKIKAIGLSFKRIYSSLWKHMELLTLQQKLVRQRTRLLVDREFQFKMLSW